MFRSPHFKTYLCERLYVYWMHRMKWWTHLPNIGKRSEVKEILSDHVKHNRLSYQETFWEVCIDGIIHYMYIFGTYKVVLWQIQAILISLCMHACSVTWVCVWLFPTPCTLAHLPSLSTGLSKQESWSGFPCLPPGDWTLVSCNPGGFFYLWAIGEAPNIFISISKINHFLQVCWEDN